jgi:hypothetical protein
MEETGSSAMKWTLERDLCSARFSTRTGCSDESCTLRHFPVSPCEKEQARGSCKAFTDKAVCGLLSLSAGCSFLHAVQMACERTSEDGSRCIEEKAFLGMPFLGYKERAFAAAKLEEQKREAAALAARAAEQVASAASTSDFPSLPSRAPGRKAAPLSEGLASRTAGAASGTQEAPAVTARTAAASLLEATSAARVVGSRGGRGAQSSEEVALLSLFRMR